MATRTKLAHDLKSGDVVIFPAVTRYRWPEREFTVLRLDEPYWAPDGAKRRRFVRVWHDVDWVSNPDVMLADATVTVRSSVALASAASTPKIIATGIELEASHALERLLPHLREVVNLVRGGHPRPYALLYEARRELNRIVATLGNGPAARSGYDWSDE